MEISVLVDEEFEGQPDAGWLKRIAEQTLVTEGASSNTEMSVVITGQERVRELNCNYRGIDAPTDVLSFGMTQGKTGSPPFVTPPDGILHLGEVIISYPQAVIQAEEHKHPVEKELKLLVVHGVLHLLGYDDDKSELRRAMRAREVAILSRI